MPPNRGETGGWAGCVRRRTLNGRMAKNESYSSALRLTYRCGCRPETMAGRHLEPQFVAVIAPEFIVVWLLLARLRRNRICRNVLRSPDRSRYCGAQPQRFERCRIRMLTLSARSLQLPETILWTLYLGYYLLQIGCGFGMQAGDCGDCYEQASAAGDFGLRGFFKSRNLLPCIPARFFGLQFCAIFAVDHIPIYVVLCELQPAESER